MIVLEKYSTEEVFHYENGFYLCSDLSRLGKLIAHFELYKKICNLPGAIIECGVFKGASFIQFLSFRNLLETQHSRSVIGFDVFDAFPETQFEDDKSYLSNFTNSAGNMSISEEELKVVLNFKNFTNFKLIKGDINVTVPDYFQKNPHQKIALLHIDTDVYEPAVTILNHMFDRIVKGGVILFDDYGTFPGETKAVDEFFADKDIIIQKLPYSHIPAYIIKPY